MPDAGQLYATLSDLRVVPQVQTIKVQKESSLATLEPIRLYNVNYRDTHGTAVAFRIRCTTHPDRYFISPARGVVKAESMVSCEILVDAPIPAKATQDEFRVDCVLVPSSANPDALWAEVDRGQLDVHTVSVACVFRPN